MPPDSPSLLEEYDESHQHPTNVRLHTFAVPMILFCVLGALGSLRLGRVNMGMMAAAVYFVGALRWKPLLGLVFGIELSLMTCGWLGLWYLVGRAYLPLLATLFVIAWILQFIGHSIEGKRPSFFRDVVFLLVGPLWTLRRVVRTC